MKLADRTWMGSKYTAPKVDHIKVRNVNELTFLINEYPDYPKIKKARKLLNKFTLENSNDKFWRRINNHILAMYLYGLRNKSKRKVLKLKKPLDPKGEEA